MEFEDLYGSSFDLDICELKGNGYNGNGLSGNGFSQNDNEIFSLTSIEKLILEAQDLKAQYS